jgi:glycosyltransferase involved in cell wall biosynthesis
MATVSLVEVVIEERRNNIRIAHFLWGRCNPDSANGVDKTVYYLARAQAQADHDVAIFSISDKPPIPVPGCDVRSYAPGRFAFRFRNDRLRDLLLRSPLNLPPSLFPDLVAWRPSVVHFHFIHLPQAIRIARRLRAEGIPYCVSPHGGLAVEAQARRGLAKTLFGILVERTYLNKAAFLHAVSTSDIEGVRAYGADNRFIVAPNCIDPSIMPEAVDGQVIARSVSKLRGRRLFVYMGRLDPEQKGLDILLKAFATVRSQDSGLVFVGPDWRQGRSRLEALAQELRMVDSFAILGPVSGKEKWDVLASADVFVHPSRWEAGTPFSVLEAMLAAKPVLVSDPADPAGLVRRQLAGVVADNISG